MAPAYGSRRFDPYGPPTTSGTSTAAPSNPPPPNRQRTLITNGRGVAGAAGVGGAGGPSQNHLHHRTGGAGGGGPRGGIVGNGNNSTVHDRFLQTSGVAPRSGGGGGGGDSRAFTNGRSSGRNNSDSYADNGYGNGVTNENPRGPVIRNGHGHIQGHQGHGGGTTRNVGAAPLSSQVHPLLASQARGRSDGDIPYADGSGDDGGSYDSNGRGRGRGRGRSGGRSRSRGGGRQKQKQKHDQAAMGFTSKVQEDLVDQARRVLSVLLGGQPSSSNTNSNEEDNEEDEAAQEDAKETARTIRLVLLFPVVLYLLRRTLPPMADLITHPKPWRWSAGVALPGKPNVARRNLAGRNCVMNYFIEKQPPDEYDPDFVEIKPGEKDKDGKPKTRPPVKIVGGTYRTKGQVHVISRFIEAVADSFRSNTNIRQHLIFAETRDGGHLAYEAVRHWPPRGKHRTTVHVVASDDLPKDKDGQRAARALGYGSLDDVEQRFRGDDRARLYDRDGNAAGEPGIGDGNDDDETIDAYEIEVPDRETLELRARSGQRKNGRRRIASNNATLAYGNRPYPDLRLMLPFEEEEDGDGELIVPYLHVDGASMAGQMQVLESARTLMEDQKVVVVGVEHSPDMDVRKLIAFFREVRYKTFFLGARQVARIDNLCEEVLDDVLGNPSVSKPQANAFRRFFIKLGLISKDELRVVGKDTDEGPRRRETPPYFVAMPRGRRSREEMTIQHMYDLFGGYGGGGGQIKTANDRKAPGK